MAADSAGIGVSLGKGKGGDRMNIRKIYQAALLILLSALLIVGITVAGMFSFIWITSHEKQSWSVSMEQILPC